MSDPLLPQEQVARLFRQADPREFSLFLGAGASRSSGVVLASEMVQEWRRQAFQEQAGPGESFDTWCERQSWYRSPTEYSELFEVLYPDERARQKYVEPKIEAGFPGWGYLYLADIVRAGRVNLIFTTNFDDLVNEALTRFAGYNAVVCAADSEVASINLVTARAKVVKLHGDYLFKALKNTEKDLRELTANMERKFAEFARQCGMLVLGYGGADQSIMMLLDRLLQKRGTFPNGIYWGIHDPQATLPAPLLRLVQQHPQRLRLFRCEDFDVFMARLHETLNLPAPEMITEPLRSARESVDRLLAQTGDRQLSNVRIREHAQKLEVQARGAIAQVSDASVLDLYEAQIAVAQRRWDEALNRVQRFSEVHPANANALTIWGSALAIQAEEQGVPALMVQAADKWREAVRADPNWTSARYHLVQHHSMRHDYQAAIAEGESLLGLAPRDSNLRLQLAWLYMNAGRAGEALQLVDALLAADPGNAQLHISRALLLNVRSRPTAALAELQRAAQILPGNAWVRFQSAAMYAKLGRFREAASDFEAAIRTDPRNADYRLNAALFFRTIGDVPQAVKHLAEAVRLEPDSAELHGQLAEALLYAPDPDASKKALAEIEAALKIDNREWRLLSTAGAIYEANGDLERAERYLREAIDCNPNGSLPYAGLAAFLARHGRPAEALNEVLRQLEGVDPMASQQLRSQLASQQLQSQLQSAGSAVPAETVQPSQTGAP